MCPGAVLEQLNRARVAPAEYATVIEQRLEHMDDMGVFWLPHRAAPIAVSAYIPQLPIAASPRHTDAWLCGCVWLYVCITPTTRSLWKGVQRSWRPSSS